MVVVFYLNDRKMFFFIFGRGRGPFAMEQFSRIDLVHLFSRYGTLPRESAFNRTNCQAASRGLLVLVLHVPSGFLRDLKHFVERHKMLAITNQSQMGSIKRLHGRNHVSLNTRQLH